MMLNRPLISIVLVAYNQEAFICDAVLSVIEQDYENLEILISDDCSTDKTYDIISQIYESYLGPHRLRINRNEKNMGIGAHVSHAVSMVKGDYIVMASGDDISLPSRVSNSVSVIENKGEMGAVIGRYHPFDQLCEDSGAWEPRHAQSNQVIKAGSNDWFKRSHQGKLVGMPGVAAMWNRKLFELFGSIPSHASAEDVVLANRCLIAGLGVAFTSDKFVFYRKHPNQITSVKRSGFERRIILSRVISLTELLSFKGQHPNRHSPEYWGKIECLLESTIFRSAVHIRQPVIGTLTSKFLLWLGLKQI